MPRGSGGPLHLGLFCPFILEGAFFNSLRNLHSTHNHITIYTQDPPRKRGKTHFFLYLLLVVLVDRRRRPSPPVKALTFGVSPVSSEMDVDYWTSRILSDKHLSSSHFNSENHLILEESDANEDARTYITCPFCYFDIELSVLSAHLQEEHCFDDKNAVCPVCALNLGKDIVGHFRAHHANSLKNQRKSHKSTFWSPNTREISSYYGSSRTGGNIDDASPDPLIAPFLYSTPYSDPKADCLQHTCISNASTSLTTESSKVSAPSEHHDKDYEKRMQRAEFLQELMFSTIL